MLSLLIMKMCLLNEYRNLLINASFKNLFMIQKEKKTCLLNKTMDIKISILQSSKVKMNLSHCHYNLKKM